MPHIEDLPESTRREIQDRFTPTVVANLVADFASKVTAGTPREDVDVRSGVAKQIEDIEMDDQAREDFTSETDKMVRLAGERFLDHQGTHQTGGIRWTDPS